MFALAGISNFDVGLFFLATVILAWLAMILILLGLAAWWVAKGIWERNGDVWWVGVILAAMSIVTPVVPVPNLTPYLSNGVGAVVGILALAYLVVRRRRFRIGVKGTTGY